jgi:8-oxo-dGTP pyrophosphatase MutT (NUDIX family)
MEKITAFVFRNDRTELLLFEHEDHTIQLPAGTMEKGESPVEAGMREVFEETGIAVDQVIGKETLDFSNNELGDDEIVIETTSQVYARPRPDSMPGGIIHRGITVRKLRERDGYCQIQYQDWNNEVEKDYMTYSLTGWVNKANVSHEKIRHYCILDVDYEKNNWVIHNDRHIFKPFWAKINALPAEIVPANKWIKVLLRKIGVVNDPNGPVEHFSWGKFIICGREHADTETGETGAGKDIRLVNQEVTKWRERKGHQLTHSMITGIYDQGVEVLILGLGVDGAITCPEDVQQAIQAKGISQVILARTPEACSLYNSFFHQGKKVALLAHGTC